MARLIPLLLLFAAPLCRPPLSAADDCSALRPDAHRAAALAIRLDVDPRLPIDVVEGAMDAWGVCTNQAREVPPFVIGERGTRELFVRFDPEAIGEGERCGSFQGREITLYTRTRNRQGSVVFCGSLTQNLIHELGHALGLADAPPSCSSFAMAKLGPNNRYHRAVRGPECRALAARWIRLPTAPTPRVEGPPRIAKRYDP